MFQIPKEQKTPAMLAFLVAAAGAWLICQYAGPMVWTPGIATILALLLFAKTRVRPRHFGTAIATTIGHLAWFVVASFVANLWLTAAPDILLLGAGIAWLWTRPGLPSALALGVLQSGSLVFNLFQLSSFPVGTPPHRALAVHTLWRLLAVGFLIGGWIRMKRPPVPTGPAEAPSASQPPG